MDVSLPEIVVSHASFKAYMDATERLQRYACDLKEDAKLGDENEEVVFITEDVLEERNGSRVVGVIVERD